MLVVASGLLFAAGCESKVDNTAENTQKALENPETSIQLLTHGNAQVRMASAARLGGMGAQAASAIPALKKLEKDPDPGVRNAAAAAIASIESAGK